MQPIPIDHLRAIFYGDSYAWEPWPGLAWSRFHYNPGRPVAAVLPSRP